jgi:alkylhydroperoxidase/carboxymuconolactone decarboxylase family protein YurZ
MTKGELPDAYEAFRTRFGAHIDMLDTVGEMVTQSVGMDAKTRHLVKLGIAAGAGLTGAVKAHARQALKAGATADQVEGVALLCLTTIGLPRSVAVLQWIAEEKRLAEEKRKRK